MELTIIEKLSYTDVFVSNLDIIYIKLWFISLKK